MPHLTGLLLLCSHFPFPWKLLEQLPPGTGFEILRRTYGELDLDENDIGGTGWFSEDPEEATWPD